MGTDHQNGEEGFQEETCHERKCVVLREQPPSHLDLPRVSGRSAGLVEARGEGWGMANESQPCTYAHFHPEQVTQSPGCTDQRRRLEAAAGAHQRSLSRSQSGHRIDQVGCELQPCRFTSRSRRARCTPRQAEGGQTARLKAQTAEWPVSKKQDQSLSTQSWVGRGVQEDNRGVSSPLCIWEGCCRESWAESCVKRLRIGVHMRRYKNVVVGDNVCVAYVGMMGATWCTPQQLLGPYIVVVSCMWE